MNNQSITPRHKLQEAVAFCGTQKLLAAELSKLLKRTIYQSHIRNWLSVTQHIPAYACRPIEEITKGLVKAHELRPDLWDAPEKNNQSKTQEQSS